MPTTSPSLKPLQLPQQTPALIEHVRSIRAARGTLPTVVLVAGGTSTGKSTLVAHALGVALGCADHVLAQDMHQLADVEALDPRYRRDDPANYGIAACEQALRAFVHGRSLIWPVYDFASGQHGPARTLAPAALLILEGLYALHPRLRGLAHVRIYVEAPAIVRLVRRLFRNLHERYPGRVLESGAVLRVIDTVMAAHRDHVTAQREHADLVVQTGTAFALTRSRFKLLGIDCEPRPPIWCADYDTLTRLQLEHDAHGVHRLRLWHQQRCYLDLPIDAPTARALSSFDAHSF